MKKSFFALFALVFSACGGTEVPGPDSPMPNDPITPHPADPGMTPNPMPEALRIMSCSDPRVAWLNNAEREMDDDIRVTCPGIEGSDPTNLYEDPQMGCLLDFTIGSGVLYSRAPKNLEELPQDYHAAAWVDGQNIVIFYEDANYSEQGEVIARHLAQWQCRAQ